MTTNLLDLHRQAVEASVAVVSRSGPSDLDRPTPCAEWNLGELLAHMTVQHHGFAAAAVGEASDLEAWQPRPLAADPVGEYADAARAVLAAFAEDGVLQRVFLLPEISPDRPFPARLAIGFHLIDYVVHGWDVAASLGVAFSLPDKVLEAALPIARAVPDGETRNRPGASFAPSLPAAPGLLGQILTALGRSPDWAG